MNGPAPSFRSDEPAGSQPDLSHPPVLPTIAARNDQLRLMLIFRVKPQVLQTSVSCSKALPGRTGVTRATANSVWHCGHIAEASGSGGGSCEAKRFPPG
jgi:hypothetical protein